MSALPVKLRPHLFQLAQGAVPVHARRRRRRPLATGQARLVLGAVAWMVTMMVMMAAMGGHDHGHRHSEGARPGDADGGQD